eukprot:3859019-Pleurochrysis_carterae.AAC.3
MRKAAPHCDRVKQVHATVATGKQHVYSDHEWRTRTLSEDQTLLAVAQNSKVAQDLHTACQLHITISMRVDRSYQCNLHNAKGSNGAFRSAADLHQGKCSCLNTGRMPMLTHPSVDEIDGKRHCCTHQRNTK